MANKYTFSPTANSVMLNIEESRTIFIHNKTGALMVFHEGGEFFLNEDGNYEHVDINNNTKTLYAIKESQ